ncbi:class I SAM-dependent methyltransferase [Candidatus Omnitrophota bacterium]
MRVDRDWWKKIFDQLYLITDARTVCDHKLTKQEVDLVEKTLRLNKQDQILDLCGGYGRHSMELARRGYKHSTVLDFSKYLIKLGRQMAQEADLQIKFVRADARSSKLAGARYSAVLVMANSFGYFPDEKENLRILREIHRLLRTGGRVLLDLSDPDYARHHLQPFSWHQANKDIAVFRQRELRGNLIKAREMVISKQRGLLRDGSYCERLYDQKQIARLLNRSGFRNASVSGKLGLKKRKKDLGLMSSRMFVTAVKP